MLFSASKITNGAYFVQETLASTGTYMDTLVLNGRQQVLSRMNRGAVFIIIFLD